MGTQGHNLEGRCPEAELWGMDGQSRPLEERPKGGTGTWEEREAGKDIAPEREPRPAGVQVGGGGEAGTRRVRGRRGQKETAARGCCHPEPCSAWEAGQDLPSNERCIHPPSLAAGSSRTASSPLRMGGDGGEHSSPCAYYPPFMHLLTRHPFCSGQSVSARRTACVPGPAASGLSWGSTYSQDVLEEAGSRALLLPWPCFGLRSGCSVSLHDRSSGHTASAPCPFSPQRHDDFRHRWSHHPSLIPFTLPSPGKEPLHWSFLEALGWVPFPARA